MCRVSLTFGLSAGTVIWKHPFVLMFSKYCALKVKAHFFLGVMGKIAVFSRRSRNFGKDGVSALTKRDLVIDSAQNFEKWVRYFFLSYKWGPGPFASLHFQFWKLMVFMLRSIKQRAFFTHPVDYLRYHPCYLEVLQGHRPKLSRP